VIALVAYEVTKALRAHGRVCAVELLTIAPTPATWRLLAVECGTMTATRSGTYRRTTLVRACDLVAMGLPDDAAHMLARECGMSDIAWADDTRREMAVQA
jgi:hypothetical protein